MASGCSAGWKTLKVLWGVQRDRGERVAARPHSAVRHWDTPVGPPWPRELPLPCQGPGCRRHTVPAKPKGKGEFLPAGAGAGLGFPPTLVTNHALK